MRPIVLVAACLASVGHARSVPQQMREIGDVPDLKTLATLLLASSPRSAYVFSGPGKQPVTVNRRGVVKMAERSGTPWMDDATTRQTQVDPVQAAQQELLQNQKKIGELQGQLSQGSRKSIDKSDIVLVQGSSLKTFSYRTSLVDRLQVVLSTDGRPLDADVQLWQGPDNTPCKMRVYSEDGSTRPFSAVIATPDSSASTVAVYNTGQIEFPLAAYVVANDVDEPVSDFRETSTIIQGGGALRTYNFDTAVESVEVMLKTNGRPLNARIELLQGPNNNKQVVELYAEDGLERPFFAIFDTIGTGNVVRIVNTAPLEYPMYASVQPHSINENVSPTDPVIGSR